MSKSHIKPYKDVYLFVINGQSGPVQSHSRPRCGVCIPINTGHGTQNNNKSRALYRYRNQAFLCWTAIMASNSVESRPCWRFTSQLLQSSSPVKRRRLKVLAEQVLLFFLICTFSCFLFLQQTSDSLFTELNTNGHRQRIVSICLYTWTLAKQLVFQEVPPSSP